MLMSIIINTMVTTWLWFLVHVHITSSGINSWLGCTKIHYKAHNNIVIKSIPNRVCYGVMAWLTTIDVLQIKPIDHFCTKTKCISFSYISLPKVLEALLAIWTNSLRPIQQCLFFPIDKILGTLDHSDGL